MYVVYNVLWIICIVLMFLTLLTYMRKKRNQQMRASEAQEQLMQGSVHPVAIDMNGRYEPPSQSNTTTYRPSDAGIEQPPPSYQDYSKDHRVPA